RPIRCLGDWSSDVWPSDLAVAEAFARAGAGVVVADLDEAGMAVVVGAIRSRGGEALAVRTDVTDLASVQALAERAFGAFGRVHVLCNNAGVAQIGRASCRERV